MSNARIPDSSCSERLKVFKSSVVYEQLKTAEQYAEICASMVDDQMEGRKENGRLFYLSVPPFAYAGIAENIHKGGFAGCRVGCGTRYLKIL